MNDSLTPEEKRAGIVLLIVLAFIGGLLGGLFWFNWTKGNTWQKEMWRYSSEMAELVQDVVSTHARTGKWPTPSTKHAPTIRFLISENSDRGRSDTYIADVDGGIAFVVLLKADGTLEINFPPE